MTQRAEELNNWNTECYTRKKNECAAGKTCPHLEESTEEGDEITRKQRVEYTLLTVCLQREIRHVCREGGEA